MHDAPRDTATNDPHRVPQEPPAVPLFTGLNLRLPLKEGIGPKPPMPPITGGAPPALCLRMEAPLDGRPDLVIEVRGADGQRQVVALLTQALDEARRAAPGEDFGIRLGIGSRG